MRSSVYSSNKNQIARGVSIFKVTMQLSESYVNETFVEGAVQEWAIRFSAGQDEVQDLARFAHFSIAVEPLA